MNREMINTYFFRFAFCVVLLSCFCKITTGQFIIPKHKGDTAKLPYDKYYFAFSLTTSYNNLATFAIIRVTPENEREVTYLSKSNFILQATGQQKSKANHKKINYFEEYRILWQTIDQLWKLRYAEYPYNNSREKGYAKYPEQPSQGQMMLLSQFGIRKINDFATGDSAFKLLQKLQDSLWVSQYKIR